MAFPSRDSSATLKAFISDFMNPEFFTDVINICLYPTEFGAMTSQGNSVINHIRLFFVEVIKQAEKLKMPNVRQIKNFADITTTILNIRESGNFISYDNVFQHIGQITDLSQQKLIQEAQNNELPDEMSFRKLVNNTIDKIGAYYEIQAIKGSIESFDNFHQYAQQPGISVFEAAKKYKDGVINLYNELTKLQCASRDEREEDFFVIKDKESTIALAQTLVKFLKTGYSYFKSGFELIDDAVSGFESSTVHLVSAPLSV